MGQVIEMNQAKHLILQVANALLMTVHECGDQGAPAGVMYAACNAQGISLTAFHHIMDATTARRPSVVSLLWRSVLARWQRIRLRKPCTSPKRTLVKRRTWSTLTRRLAQQSRLRSQESLPMADTNKLYHELETSMWKSQHRAQHEAFKAGKVYRLPHADRRASEFEQALIQRGQAAKAAFLREHPDQAEGAHSVVSH
jgi:hypothetical protein